MQHTEYLKNTMCVHEWNESKEHKACINSAKIKQDIEEILKENLKIRTR